MSEDKARAIGINHVALEVADIDAALAFYGRLFDFTLRGRGERSAFIDLGDQFIALFKGESDTGDVGRHFGLVVDDPGKVRRQLEEMGVEILDGPGVDFHDPWGNYWQMVRSRPRASSARRTWTAWIFFHASAANSNRART